MSESPTGWYEDDDVPGLARWWDGTRWTEHTMAIPVAPEAGAADLGLGLGLGDLGATDADEDDLSYFPEAADEGDAAEPLPARSGSSRFPRPGEEPTAGRGASVDPDPTAVGALAVGSFGELDDTDNPFFAPTELPAEQGMYRPDWIGRETSPRHRRDGAAGGAGGGFAERYRAWPGWARIVLPVLAIALMVGLAVAAASSIGGSKSGSDGNTTDATFSAPSSSTTAVTFVPLGPPVTLGDTTTTALPTTTTGPVTTTTRRAVTPAPTTTTTTAPTTTTTTAPTTTTIVPTTDTTESPVPIS